MKAYYITNGNVTEDVILENNRIAERTLDYIKKNEGKTEWLKTYIRELDIEGEVKMGTNILTTVYRNSEPYIAVVNEPVKAFNLIYTYNDCLMDDDYNKYQVRVDMIRRS